MRRGGWEGGEGCVEKHEEVGRRCRLRERREEGERGNGSSDRGVARGGAHDDRGEGWCT